MRNGEMEGKRNIWIQCQGLSDPKSSFVTWRQHVMNLHLHELSLAPDKRIIPYSGSLHTCLSLDCHDQRYLLTSCIDGRIMLHDLHKLLHSTAHKVTVEKLSTRHETSGHMYTATSIEWYPIDNGAFLTASLDCTVKIWDTNLFMVAGTFKLSDRVFSAKMRADGLCNYVVAAAVGDGMINLCDLRTNDAEHHLSGPEQSILSIDWCPNEEYLLASGSADGMVCLWDVRRGGRKALLGTCDWQQSISSHRKLSARGHEKAVMSVKFSPCGNYLVSCGNDRKVRCWKTFSGTLLPTRFASCHKSSLPYHISFATGASALNDILLFPSYDAIHAAPLHSTTGESLTIFRGHVSRINCVMYVSEYHCMLSCGSDGMILLWEADKTPMEVSDSESQSDSDITSDGGFVPPIIREMFGEDV